jgi:flagellar biosynthesis component FlhA
MTDEIQEFALITEFLACIEPIVVAHEALTDEVRDLLTRIARGEASDEDRSRAVPVLNASSEAIDYLARQLRSF